ncbi:MAG: hypothetical protein V3U65_01975 [Granulosicoccaceae bacterium]
MSEAPSGRSPVNFMVYVANADEALSKAVAAGMTLVSEVEKDSADNVNKRAADWLASMG